ncbi:MAG: GNAT family N-acetyltransferase [Conexivisphaerales archaeon]
MIRQSRFESDVVLKDGSLAHVRPLKNNDHDQQLLAQFVRELSDESMYFRFLTAAYDRSQVIERLMPKDGRFCIIAEREGKIIGHAAYYMIDQDKAEPGLVISDSYQGKGLGTILLAQLTEAANEQGISIFETYVSPENYRMINLVKNSGFHVEVKVEPGQILLTFPTSLAPEAVERFERREQVATFAAVQKFLYPNAVAVIGASRQRDSIGGQLFHNIISTGFNGPVYPVNPNANFVQSIPAYHSVLDCPGNIDLAVISVPARYVSAVAKECAEKGIKSLVIISAGFSEAGPEGVKLQQELMDICREYGMRVIGPNCMGIINTDANVMLNAQFSQFFPKGGSVGFLSQSGALGIAVIEHANKLGVGLSSFVSVGNKADISGNDLIQFWEQDERTKVILLYLESFGNPKKFSRIARRVGKKKPIIVVKSGRSSAGFRATQSHTGALLASSDAAVDALFRQCGVIRTDTLEDMFDVASLLSTQPLPKGNSVAIITNAGGAGILAADACEAVGLTVPELNADVQYKLRQVLSTGAAVRNPVDMIASATADDYRKAMQTVFNDPNIDSMIVIFVPPLTLREEDVAKVILEETEKAGSDKPVLACFMASRGVPEMLSNGKIKIPAYPFPEEAAKALGKAVEYKRWLEKPEGEVRKVDGRKRAEAASLVSKILKEGRGWLSMEETNTLLGYYGIPVINTYLARTADEAADIAAKMQTKMVVKGTAEGLVHKTEAGAVVLGLEGKNAVYEAAQSILTRLKTSGYKNAGLVIQPMAEGGVEMLVGSTFDPVFGPLVVCGAGGTLVELLKDVSVSLTPVTDTDLEDMLKSLRVYKLLTGLRGGAKYDVASIKDILFRLSCLVEDIPEVVEIDLNPVMVFPEGKGALTLDARIRVGETKPPLPIGAKKR